MRWKTVDLIFLAIVGILMMHYNILSTRFEDAGSSGLNVVRVELFGAGPADSILPTGQCQYHGNCPTGSVCAHDNKCWPYELQSQLQLQPQPQSQSQSQSQLQLPEHTKPPESTAHHDECVQTCLTELTIEEGFLYGSIPKVEFTQVAAHPHSGCVLYYQRQRRQGNWTERPSVEYRLAARSRSVVRVDASNRMRSSHAGWMAYCGLPCQSDSNCLGAQSACRGRPGTPTTAELWSFPKTCQQAAKPQVHDMVVVTGSDEAYFHALENFVAALEYWSPARKLVVYNLGMQDHQLEQVKSWPNVLALHWEQGIPKALPAHVHKLKLYAWKSLAINETVHKYRSIFWLDAGATFVSPIEPIEEIMQRQGLFLVKGQDASMSQNSHPDMYKWHGQDKENYITGPSFAGGIQGHVYPSRYIDTIVIPNAQCAMDEGCIHPKGSNLANHRYDQSSLSILAYQPNVQAPAYTEFLAGGIRQLNANLREPSSPFIMWTARATCSYYIKI